MPADAPAVAILCGGRGTRIAAIAGTVPKALLPVAGEPFITHQLRWLREHGLSTIVLLVGVGADQIEAFVGDGGRFGVEVQYSADGASPRGTGGAILRALPLLGTAFLTVYGDSLLPIDPFAVARALQPGDDGVMSVFRNADERAPSNVCVDGDRVVRYDKQAPLGSMTHIDYGVNAFRSSAFREVSPDRAVDLAEVHQAMIARNRLRAFAVAEPWHEIGSPEGLAETEHYLRARRGRSA